MPKNGKDLINYIERIKRKAQNRKEREILIKCLGSSMAELNDKEEQDSDSDSDASDMSDNEEADQLAAPELDIPRTAVSDIPVLSKLTKKQQVSSVVKDKAERVEQVDKVMDNEEEQLQTHFVENPYILAREKATRK